MDTNPDFSAACSPQLEADADFARRLPAGWEKVHEGSAATSVPEAPGVAVPAVSMAFPATTSTLPAHREWKDLHGLDLSALMERLGAIKQRCAAARVHLDASLLQLDTLVRSFTSAQSIESSSDVANYIRTFKIVLDASRGIFPPQDAYRAAITTLGLFVTDLIDVLPRESAEHTRLRTEFDTGMLNANAAEEGVRKGMRELVGTTQKGQERYGVAVYMHLMRERAKNWGEEEERFKAWAVECVAALL